jgi:hypothetical protein
VRGARDDPPVCCFSRPVKHVSQTQLFARASTGNRQLLAYSMSFAAREDLAMILPLPVPPAPPEDAVRFIDMSGYPDFFADLRKGFPPIYLPQPKGRSLLPRASAERTLKVHAVGDFEASFVPKHSDFARLDERFRLSNNVWNQLPRYHDYGFAVFKLKGSRRWLFGARTRSVHPMAFELPRRDPQALFFPTVHVHDGQVHAEAHFDHSLYCQADDARASGWERSRAPAKTFVRVAATGGLVDGEQPCRRRVLLGLQANDDVVV